VTGPSIVQQIYAALPEVYRSEDRGDLSAFLAGFGEVLDLVRGALDQRLADAFPDHPRGQPWLLPYFADLLDVRLLSPDDAGRRSEVANGIAWRRRKGALGVVLPIAAGVGGFGLPSVAGQPPNRRIEVQEGLLRVAVTPRVGIRFLPASAYPVYPPPPSDGAGPREVIAHPALPAATVDLRFHSRRVLVPVPGGGTAPVQAYPHGVPCFPGTFEDVSRRTPDLRAPGWRTGHFHARRLLLFLVPPAGFFPDGWRTAHADAGPFDASLLAGPAPVEDRNLTSAAPLPAVNNPLTLRGCVLEGDLSVAAGAGGEVLLEDCVVDGKVTVSSGRLVLKRSAVRSVAVAGGSSTPAAALADSLVGDLTATGAEPVRLVASTVLGALVAAAVEASDALLAGPVTVPAAAGICVRFSRIPAALRAALPPTQAHRCVTDVPIFVATAFGDSGCGVLHPASGDALRAAAEDGGALGAEHRDQQALRECAVLDKVTEFLPVGMSPVLVPDARLACTSPQAQGGNA